MRRPGWSAVALLLVLPSSNVGALPAGPPISQPRFAKKIHIAGVSDAGKLNDYLYRGTQPTQKGLKNLRRLGIDTIVDLRGEFRSTMKKERANAEKLGMRLLFIPGNGWSPPKDEQVAEFFALVAERPQHKIFVHCWLGGDRSGVFLAAYRIAFDGWTPEQALAEMPRFRYHGFWHPAMTRYIRDFPARLRRSPVLARYRHGVALAGTDSSLWIHAEKQSLPKARCRKGL
jgi:tyrosine-protein phosphatase SIW14